MTTTLLDRIPLDEITEQAQQVRPGRTALTLIAAVLYGLGWITARVFAAGWLAAVWSAVAVREGWRASHGPSRKTRIADLEATVEQQKIALSRFSG